MTQEITARAEQHLAFLDAQQQALGLSGPPSVEAQIIRDLLAEVQRLTASQQWQCLRGGTCCGAFGHCIKCGRPFDHPIGNAGHTC